MSLVRDEIEAMAGYTPGEQPQAGKFIKLNTNENPYPPSPNVASAEWRSASVCPAPDVMGSRARSEPRCRAPRSDRRKGATRVTSKKRRRTPPS